jgi:hypothetical protein
MALNYGWEKLHLAVMGAALSGDSLQEKLKSAYLYNVALLRAEDVPEDVWPRIEEFKKKLTSAKVDQEIVDATISKMSDMDARGLVMELVSMYDSVAREYGK